MKEKIVPVERARKGGKQMAANEKEFSKIVIQDTDGREYTLEFNARVVKNMERRGFKIDTDYPNTMIEQLFTGAFQMHHKGMMSDRIMEIWAHQSKKTELLGVLTQLYMKPLEDLMKEDEDEEKNDTPTWKTV